MGGWITGKLMPCAPTMDSMDQCSDSLDNQHLETTEEQQEPPLGPLFGQYNDISLTFSSLQSALVCTASSNSHRHLDVPVVFVSKQEEVYPQLLDRFASQGIQQGASNQLASSLRAAASWRQPDYVV